MQYLLLALTSTIIGCLAVDAEPGESEAVGSVTSCPPEQQSGLWCIETAPTTGLLHGVWAVTASDVFAVGDSGTILRRTNDTWTAMTSGTTNNLRGVWAASSTDVWAVGSNATILHFDGSQWSPVSGAGTTVPVDAVWGSSANDVWMCGGNRCVRWNGQSLTTHALVGTILSVSGTGPNDVWVSGENANPKHWNGSTWTSVNPGSGLSNYPAMLAISATDVWAAATVPGKETMHLEAGRWVARTTSAAFLNEMSALAANDIWGAANSGKVTHWNGTSWTTESPTNNNTSIALYSVTTLPGDAWVVGGSGWIAHRPL